MMRSGQSPDVHPEDNIVVRIFRRFLPVTRKIYEEKFFIKRHDRIIAMTPMFLALLVVETSDIMFAFDSIPAIFAITSDPFIVFTSNIFAILGLRSMYFVLASVLDKFEHLKYSLAVILAFVGVKMVVFHPLHIDVPEWVSLLVILILLIIGVISSLIKSQRLKVKEGGLIEKVEQKVDQTA